MRISDWSSDVCSSDLLRLTIDGVDAGAVTRAEHAVDARAAADVHHHVTGTDRHAAEQLAGVLAIPAAEFRVAQTDGRRTARRRLVRRGRGCSRDRKSVV